MTVTPKRSVAVRRTVVAESAPTPAYGSVLPTMNSSEPTGNENLLHRSCFLFADDGKRGGDDGGDDEDKCDEAGNEKDNAPQILIEEDAG